MTVPTITEFFCDAVLLKQHKYKSLCLKANIEAWIQIYVAGTRTSDLFPNKLLGEDNFMSRDSFYLLDCSILQGHLRLSMLLSVKLNETLANGSSLTVLRSPYAMNCRSFIICSVLSALSLDALLNMRINFMTSIVYHRVHSAFRFIFVMSFL